MLKFFVFLAFILMHTLNMGHDWEDSSLSFSNVFLSEANAAMI